MSAFNDVVDKCIDDLINTTGEANVDKDLVAAVAKGLGPSIYNKDASTVSSGDPEELARVRENFVKGKLGVTASDEDIDASIDAIVTRVGRSNRNKYRVTFYYLLTKNFNKEEVYTA